MTFISVLVFHTQKDAEKSMLGPFTLLNIVSLWSAALNQLLGSSKSDLRILA